MKMKLAVNLLLSLFVGTLVSLSLHAQSFTNLAGIWNGLSFNVPAQLQPQFDGSVVTNVAGHAAFGANALQVHVFANGTFTNVETTGTISIDGQGKLTVYPVGAPAISFRANYAQDIFAGIADNSSSDGPQNELDLFVRSPDTCTTNDLIGTWRMSALDMPEELIQSFLPTTNASAVSDLLGLDNQSVDNSPLSQGGGGFITFNPDGTASGMAGDAFTGTFALATNGECDLTITPSGGPAFPLTAFANASKDTAVALHLDNPNNRQEIVVLTKPPTNAALADLQGAWKVTSFDVPDQVFLTRNASNWVTGVQTSDGFSKDQQAFTAGNDGFLTGILDGGANIGGLTVSTDGIVTVSFTNLVGQTQSHTAQLNAGKNCLTVVEDDGSQTHFNVVTKAPDFPSAGGQDFGLLLFGNSICWAARTNRTLQSDSALNGIWSDVSGTQGLHQFPIAATNTAGFYRVRE